MSIARMRQSEDRQKIYGVTIGLVTKLSKNDDEIGHRVKLKFPWLSDQDESDWARVVSIGAGKDRGFYCLPEVGDEVLVAFEHGDVARPYVLGTLWNGKDKATDKNDSDKNDHRSFKSRSGHLLEFDDKDGEEKITLKAKSGAHLIIDDKDKVIHINDHANENKVTIDQKGKKISVESTSGDINIKAKENINIECKKLNVKSSDDSSFEAKNFKIKASSNFEAKANGSGTVESSGGMTIKGSTVNIN